MLKSCHYCGRIHDKSYVCPQKEQADKRRQKKEGTRETRFRYTKAWKDKREEIQNRDKYCCQICIRGEDDPDREYETEDLSVHHIDPLVENWDARLDNDNLITLCRRHHERAEMGVISKKRLKEIAAEQEGLEDCVLIC